MSKYSKEVLAWEVVVHPELALARRLLVFILKSLEVILAFHLENTITLCGFDMGRWYVFCMCHLVDGSFNNRFWSIMKIFWQLL